MEFVYVVIYNHDVSTMETYKDLSNAISAIATPKGTTVSTKLEFDDLDNGTIELEFTTPEGYTTNIYQQAIHI